ncbi:MAG: hypothetical protein KTR27_10820, partial [Leptolyngbyaceae cyanobacterium MAG.088]|nr:hypothetical protein [Leptolyngbyaceae cyanobacterium MAG.088]
DISKPNPEYDLFKDIYAYLKAWVKCSLSHDSNQLMPISTIGLNYPNKDAYLTAFEFIVSNLLEKQGVEEFLPKPESRQILQDFLRELMHAIDAEN